MRKKSRALLALFALAVLCAALLWYFWSDVRKLVEPGREKPAAGQAGKASQEKISEEDRKKLEEILKRK